MRFKLGDAGIHGTIPYAQNLVKTGGGGWGVRCRYTMNAVA